MFKTFRSRWTVFNSLGFVLGFLSFGLVGAIVGLFKPEAIPDGFRFYQSVDEIPGEIYNILYQYGIITHLVMYPVFGAILGSIQAYVLRKAIPSAWTWIGITALGFVSIVAFELVQRHIIIGPFPGPVEPIMIALGAGGLAGIFQWFYLRKENYPSAKWLGLWIVGLMTGIILAAAVMIGLSALIGDAIMYLETNIPELAIGIELTIFGSIVGAVAGWFSSRSLKVSLGIPDPYNNPPNSSAV